MSFSIRSSSKLTAIFGVFLRGRKNVPLLYPSLNATFSSVAPIPVDESPGPSLPALLPRPANWGDPGFTRARAAAPRIPGAVPYPWSFLSLSVWGHCDRCHNEGFFRAIFT